MQLFPRHNKLRQNNLLNQSYPRRKREQYGVTRNKQTKHIKVQKRNAPVSS